MSTCNYHTSPLILATREVYYDCVDLLIQAGADVNVGDKSGQEQTALMYAAEKGFHYCVELLVKAGPDFGKVSKLGNSALRNAASEDHLDIVKFLLNLEKDNTARKKAMNEAVMFAVNTPNCLEYLINKGVDMSTSSPIGQTSIHKAAEKFNEECFHPLMKARADVNKMDNFGNTALQAAAQHENLRCIKTLLGSGAFINKSTFGANALMMHRTTYSTAVNKPLAILLYVAGENATSSDSSKYPFFCNINRTRCN